MKIGMVLEGGAMRGMYTAGVLDVFLDKDVSAIAPLINLSWAKNAGISAMYLWMAKHEHLMDKKIEYKKLGLESDNIDEELMEIESENFEVEIDG